MFMNRWLLRQEIIDLNELSPEEERAVFSILKPYQGEGERARFLESDADAAIEEVRRRPQDSNPLSSGGEEDRNVIDFNGTLEPFERIADGIERLIALLMPKEAVSPTQAPPMLAPAEAAVKMRLNEQTVMRWCRERRLQASKIGGKWLIPQESVDAFVRKCELIHGRRGGK
jgi:excisionase family DNA binding protein